MSVCVREGVCLSVCVCVCVCVAHVRACVRSAHVNIQIWARNRNALSENCSAGVCARLRETCTKAYRCLPSK